MKVSKKKYQHLFYMGKKILVAFVFLAAVISINACKTTHSCTSIEKQEINTTKTNTNTVATKVAT